MNFVREKERERERERERTRKRKKKGESNEWWVVGRLLDVWV